ncbi:hypothetical protein ACIA6D_23375 [Streptomyces cacaoi]
MTPADQPAAVLRAAAAKLRALAKAIDAPDLPDQTWHTEECADDDRGNCPCIVAQGSYAAEPSGALQPLYYVADAETPEVAAYITAMGPNVGTALAEWLESAARDAQEIGPDPHALAVARAVLGTPDQQP